MQKIKNIHSGKVVEVYPTADHPDCSYGQEVWVDSDGRAYGIVGYPILGYDFVVDRHHVIDVIDSVMRERGITIYKLSQLSGLSQPTIANMLDGTSSPSLDTLDKVCKQLGIKITAEKENE